MFSFKVSSWRAEWGNSCSNSQEKNHAHIHELDEKESVSVCLTADLITNLFKQYLALGTSMVFENLVLKIFELLEWLQLMILPMLSLRKNKL